MTINNISNIPNFKGKYVITGSYKDLRKFENTIEDELYKNVPVKYNIDGKDIVVMDTRIRNPQTFKMMNSDFVVDVPTQKNEFAELFVTNNSVLDLIKYRAKSEPYRKIQSNNEAFNVVTLFDIAAKKSNEALSELIKTTNIKLKDIFTAKTAKDIRIIEAKDALKAIEDNKFDFVEGVIK